MLNLQLYDMAKVREQEFIAEAARHNRVPQRHGSLVASVSRLFRRGERSQH